MPNVIRICDVLRIMKNDGIFAAKMPLRRTSLSKNKYDMKKLLSLSLLAMLTACGGGGGGDSSNSSSPVTSYPASSTLANLCVNPRANSADRQGTVDNEKAYLRSFIDETYLWYKDVPTNLVAANYATPQAYFDVLKTPLKTASGKLVDEFHWSQTTESWNAASSGIERGYGIQWASQSSSTPRNWIVAEVEPGSPAALAGVKRGNRLTSVDGIDFVNDNTTSGTVTLNAGLLESSGKAHKFGFNGEAEISLTPATYTKQTVKNVKIIPTAQGNIGYFIFDAHLEKSVAEVIAAIEQLKAANVNDLVIDMRYNGGGLIAVASGLAYAIAGPTATNGKTFEQYIHNDKLTERNMAVPFYASSPDGQAVPYLGLKRVSLLVSQGTASASEAFINGLRGVNVQVDLIGDTTRGKPYGFAPQDNCGYTYFAIQFKGVNDKGYGDYADGFEPTCKATDDYSHLRGDVEETMLKTALTHRLTGACPSTSRSLAHHASRELKYELVRPATKEMRILTGIPTR